MQKVYVVEVESGSTDHGCAMLFDSVWTTEERAREYAQSKFAQCGWASQAPEWDVTEVTLEE